MISICLWLFPDIIMFLLSIIVFIVLRKLTIITEEVDLEDAEPQTVSESESTTENTYTPEQYVILKRTGKTHLDPETGLSIIFKYFIHLQPSFVRWQQCCSQPIFNHLSQALFISLCSCWRAPFGHLTKKSTVDLQFFAAFCVFC